MKLSGEKVVDGDRINCDNNNLVIESDCEEEDDEDDWDWDSDEEHASVQCVDMAEFEDLFQVNLLVTNLVPCQPLPALGPRGRVSPPAGGQQKILRALPRQ